MTTTADWLTRQSLTFDVGVNINRDGSRIYVREEGAVHDARTGAVLFTVPVQSAKPFFTAMLPDGSVIVTRDGKLVQFDRNGGLSAEIPIPLPQARVAAQVGASKVLLSSGGNSPGGWRLLVVDLVTRRVEAELPGYLSMLPWWGNPQVPHLTEDTTIVAMNAQHEFTFWDFRTGTKRRLPS